MKLSEAVLLGLGEIRFTNDHWLGISSSSKYECEGCLAGAAIFAMGLRQPLNIDTKLEEFWPWVRKYRIEAIPCPVTGCGNIPASSYFGFANVLTHVACHFKVGRFSAEQIADWLHSIEQEEDANTSSGREQSVLAQCEEIAASNNT